MRDVLAGTSQGNYNNMYHYISVGSNIDPEVNIVRCLETLLARFGNVFIYPCTYTQPVNIVTDKRFINTLGVIRSDLSPRRLKQVFCEIEEALGRDRADVERSYKDRTCDIDIICSDDRFCLDYFKRCDEAYLQAVLSTGTEKVQVSLLGLTLADRPAAINFQGAAGHETVVEYEANAL